MSISRLFWWIYQLPLVDLILMLFASTLVFLQLRRRFPQRSWLIALLAAWTAAALWVTILNRKAGAMGAFQLFPLHSYRESLATGNLEILRSSLMNVALFYPAGLLSAALMPGKRSPLRRLMLTAFLFALFSLSIEAIQYVRLLGNAEIDDVIHNTLGASLGCLAFHWGGCSREHICI